MTPAMVTVMAPLSRVRLAEAHALLDTMGNPAAPAMAAALGAPDEEAGIHFLSLHAIPSEDGVHAWLALELTADGAGDDALEQVASALPGPLGAVFALAEDWVHGRNLAHYLRDRQVAVGGGWLSNPGVAFAGTPGMTVGRIRREGALAARLASVLGAQPGGMAARDRLEGARRELRRDPSLAWAFTPPDGPPPFHPSSTPALAGGLAASFVKTFLWPLGLALLAVALAAGLLGAAGVGTLVVVLRTLAYGVLVLLGLVLAAAAVAYALLRRAERTDALDERAPDRAVQAALLARENRCAQNHMLSVTRRKPGAVRAFTIRLVFWLIGQLAARLYYPGFLGGIGTIHSARWVTPPGNRDLLFFSNYGGSWESYLEDFITRAHAGLTAVWSNSCGFPRTENLFQRGATDGERFKRYARRSMVPTRFWFSAYPDLTTSRIRTNALVRRGFSAAMTADEAAAWLALFGSAARPEGKLVSSQIQSLVFGGLGFLPHGAALLYQLPERPHAARRWLAGAAPHIAFNDGRRLGRPAAVTLGLSPGGLSRLGLPAEGLHSFPAAFLDGMTAPGRAHILGDTGPNAAEHWAWGQATPDAVLLAYGETPDDVAALRAALDVLAAQHGAVLDTAIPLHINASEPFGFADGVSQPVIRGTYKGLQSADPIHLMEAGEFVGGYPDNRGNRPPGPTLPAIADPLNQLPLVAPVGDFAAALVDSPRDLGANGTFLVIRHLEQDVQGFHAYCEAEAERLRDRLAPPYKVDASFIAAKLVGRWPSGASLVRFPYLPPHQERRQTHPLMRPKPKAEDATPVERPPEPSGTADNDFLFGTEDPEGLRCPFGAHIRRANPRDSQDPGSAEQTEITNRHRLLRVGRLLSPDAGGKPGLLFMCLNGDIERQFEFVQQSWLMSPSFHGLSCEKDPLMGDAQDGQCGHTIPSRDGPVRLAPLPRFVTTRGGGYFFMPGRQLVDYLKSPLHPPGAALVDGPSEAPPGEARSG